MKYMLLLALSLLTFASCKVNRAAVNNGNASAENGQNTTLSNPTPNNAPQRDQPASQPKLIEARPVK